MSAADRSQERGPGRARTVRWTLLGLVVVVGLAVALSSTLTGPGAGSQEQAATPQAPPVGRPPSDEPASTATDEQRRAADLPACRDHGAAATTTGPLASFMVRCTDDGAPTTLGKIQAGAPMLVNLWAYWCEPCRRELPALQAAQQRLGGRLRVVLSHTDPAEAKGVDTLTALGVHLVSVSDQEELLPATLGAPPVLPVSVLVRADGSIARVLTTPMTDERQVLDAVSEHLGVAA